MSAKIDTSYIRAKRSEDESIATKFAARFLSPDTRLEIVKKIDQNKGADGVVDHILAKPGKHTFGGV